MTPVTKTRLPVALTLCLYFLVLIRTAWVHEDAFVTFRTIRNLLEGFGPVWNVGERVQAYTHPLWMFLLSGAIGLTGEFYYTTITVSLLISAIAVLLLVRDHAESAATVILLVLLLTLSKAYTDFSTSGLENPLTHLLLVCFALLYFRQEYTPTTLLLVSFVVGLAVLNRMDVALLYAPALLYVWYRVGWRVGLAPVVVGFLPFLLWELFSLIYYGFPFPNTAYAKLNTGIPQAEYWQKGLLYFVHTTGADPLTSAVIVIGLVFALLDNSWRLRWLAVGVLLYLTYVLYIGGDYMVGRFLTAPFLVAVIYLASAVKPQWNRAVLAPTIVLVIVIGLMSPRQSPLFSDDQYALRRVNSEGIADERSWYQPALGLLTADRLNRAYEMGAIQGTVDPANAVEAGVGRTGFNASTYTYIIDQVGLADPLLARLPARYNPSWRIGHPVRVSPPGYETSRWSGETVLLDPDLAAYYDRLSTVVHDDLWSWARLAEIIRFNRGAYNHLIDEETYRYPTRMERSLEEVSRLSNQEDKQMAVPPLWLPLPLPMNQDGALIRMGTVRHEPAIEAGFESDRFTLFYFNRGTQIGVQKVRAQALRLGDQTYHLVIVPSDVAAAGYTDLHIRPDLSGEYLLTFVDLTQEPGKGPLPAEQLAEQFYYTFYRGERGVRTAKLEALMAQLQALPVEAWRHVPTAKLLDLLRVPDPALADLIFHHLPGTVVLSDENERPVLRYLGHSAAGFVREKGSTGLQVRLAFEALDRIDQEHSLWFHIRSLESDDEWMVYDFEIGTPVTEWAHSGLHEIEGAIALDPGRYDIAFGFWTSERARLYVNSSEDIYWISLGEHTIDGK